MRARYVVAITILLLGIVLIGARTQAAARGREGLSSSGPAPEKLAETNTNNVAYLQAAVGDMKKVYDYMMDVSGQEQTNKEGIKKVAQRTNQVRNKMLHGAPPKKLPSTSGEAEQESVKPARPA